MNSTRGWMDMRDISPSMHELDPMWLEQLAHFELIFFFLSHLKPRAPCYADALCSVYLQNHMLWWWRWSSRWLLTRHCQASLSIALNFLACMCIATDYTDTSVQYALHTVVGHSIGPVRLLFENQSYNPSKEMCDMRACPVSRAAQGMMLNCCDCSAQSLCYASMYQLFFALLCIEGPGQQSDALPLGLSRG